MFQMDACALFLLGLGEESRGLCIPATDSIRKHFSYYDFPPSNESAVIVDPAAMGDVNSFSNFIENCTRFARCQDGVVFIYPPVYSSYENGAQSLFGMELPPIIERKGPGPCNVAPVQYDIVYRYWCPPTHPPAGIPQVRFLLSVHLGRGFIPRRQCSKPDLSCLWR